MKLLLHLLAALILLLPVRGLCGDLLVLTHNLEGQAAVNEQTGELRGFAHAGKRAFNLEVVRELMLALGLSPRIREVSFSQGIAALESHDDVAFFNVYRTPERESRYKWVGPLQREVDYLYGLSETADFETLEAAGQAPAICAVEGSHHHDVLKRRGFKNIVTAHTYLECFSMVKSGKATLAVSSDETLLRKLKLSDITANAIRRVPEPLYQSAGYIAFSPAVDEEVIRHWQSALNALISTGRFQELYEAYYER